MTQNMSHAQFLKRVEQFFNSEYEDRGMKKWQGFFLSDHTAALKREAQSQATGIVPLPLMEQEEVRAVLGRAFANGLTVEIQATDVDTELSLLPNLRGKVMGYSGADSVALSSGDTMPIDRIRHVKIISAT